MDYLTRISFAPYDSREFFKWLIITSRMRIEKTNRRLQDCAQNNMGPLARAHLISPKLLNIPSPIYNGKLGRGGDDLLRNEVGDLHGHGIGAGLRDRLLNRDSARDGQLLALHIDYPRFALPVFDYVYELLPVLLDYVLDLEGGLKGGLVHLRVINLEEQGQVLTRLVDSADEGLDLVTADDELALGHGLVIERLDRSGENQGAGR